MRIAPFPAHGIHYCVRSAYSAYIYIQIMYPTRQSVHHSGLFRIFFFRIFFFRINFSLSIILQYVIPDHPGRFLYKHTKLIFYACRPFDIPKTTHHSEISVYIYLIDQHALSILLRFSSRNLLWSQRNAEYCRSASYYCFFSLLIYRVVQSCITFLEVSETPRQNKDKRLIYIQSIKSRLSSKVCGSSSSQYFISSRKTIGELLPRSA